MGDGKASRDDRWGQLINILSHPESEQNSDFHIPPHCLLPEKGLHLNNLWSILANLIWKSEFCWARPKSTSLMEWRPSGVLPERAEHPSVPSPHEAPALVWSHDSSWLSGAHHYPGEREDPPKVSTSFSCTKSELCSEAETRSDATCSPQKLPPCIIKCVLQVIVSEGKP